jgi:hypothetical protein
MNKRKEKYKNNLKKIGDETLNDLEPLIKNSGDKLIDIIKEILHDSISDLFHKRREGKKYEKTNINTK